MTPYYKPQIEGIEVKDSYFGNKVYPKGEPENLAVITGLDGPFIAVVFDNEGIDTVRHFLGNELTWM